jgi:hypothetical protein
LALPNHRPYPKSWCSLQRLQYCLFGCLSSSDKRLHWYSWPNLVPEDPMESYLFCETYWSTC